MKILMVADIAPTSTKDCYVGIRGGLVALGHDVPVYPTWAYTEHLLKPYPEQDLAKMDPDIRATIFGAIGQMICGAATLHRPDWVFVVSGWVMPREVVDALRLIGIKCALYLTESPYQDQMQAEHPAFGAYDLIICNEKASVPYLSGYHDHVVYMPHSFDPETHFPQECADEPTFDVFMCGTGFSERRNLIKAAPWGDARVQLVGFWPGDDPMPQNVELRQGTLRNSDLPPIYHAAPINLNIHRTTKVWKQLAADEEHIGHAESIGPRVFEVLACEGFLMTDHRAELADAGLRDGHELVVFADANDLGEKARWYLQHPGERKRIAANGRAAVQGCTFANRVQSVLLPAMKG